MLGKPFLWLLFSLEFLRGRKERGVIDAFAMLNKDVLKENKFN